MKQKERKKTTARKPKYGFFSCVAYSLGVMWKSSKGTAVSAVAVIPVSLALYAIGLYMPSILLRELELGDAGDGLGLFAGASGQLAGLFTGVAGEVAGDVGGGAGRVLEGVEKIAVVRHG